MKTQFAGQTISNAQENRDVKTDILIQIDGKLARSIEKLHREYGPGCAGIETELSRGIGIRGDTVGRVAAEGTGEFIDAPYRFEVLPGVGHYAADQVPDKVNALLLTHLRQHAD